MTKERTKEIVISRTHPRRNLAAAKLRRKLFEELAGYSPEADKLFEQILGPATEPTPEPKTYQHKPRKYKPRL